MSGAPGIRIGNILILAGVPHIAAMMLDSLTGTLEGGRCRSSPHDRLPRAPKARWPICSPRPKSAHPRLPDRLLSLLPRGMVGANFVIRSTDEVRLKACEDDLATRLIALGYEVVAGGI
jgi:hypothetical protein